MRWRRCSMVPTTFAPAVLAREASSPRGSRGSAVDLGRITPTRMARSRRTVSSVRVLWATVGILGHKQGIPNADRILRFVHIRPGLKLTGVCGGQGLQLAVVIGRYIYVGFGGRLTAHELE